MNNPAKQRYESLNRRRFLRGLGAAVALPMLPSLLPRIAAAAPEGAAGRLATTAGGAPLRSAFIYFPNGAIPSTWWPEGTPGKDFSLNKSMEPLAELRDQFQVLGGLDCLNADKGNDGGGDHARAGGAYLTGVRVKKTSTDVRAGVSIDQVIAKHVGHLTPFRSLELTCDPVRTSGSCDSGYSCAYSYNLAWRAPESPVTPEPNPRLVFERMFGAGAPGERKANLERRMARQKSILDFVLDDARSVETTLGARDRIKLDEYLTGLRDIEARIQRAEKNRDATPDPKNPTPSGVPTHYGEYVQLMFDMLTLAFQTDQTRVATFMLAYEGSNRPMPHLGIAEGHHNLSHHNSREEMISKVKVIDRWYVEQFAGFLKKLNAIQDADGTSLLQNSMICYGSGHSDGNKHTHDNLPILLAGGGGGALTPGRYQRFNSLPVANLFLSMADRMGCHGIATHGDSTGRIENL